MGFHPFGFGWMNLRSWRDAPKWGASSLAGILAKSSIVSWCVERACVRWRLHVFAINLEFSPLTYTLGFSHSGVRDNLTHYVHLKRELELLQEFDSLPSHLTRIASFFFSFLLHSWYIHAREGVRIRSDKVAECWSEEHRKFVEQEEEEGLLVNGTSRWIVVINY